MVISRRRHDEMFFLIPFFFSLSETLPNIYSRVEKEANKIGQLKQWHISCGAVQKPSGRFIRYPPNFKRISTQDLIVRRV